MPDRLAACRNMGVYFNMFEATLSELDINYKEILSDKPGLFLLRQHYPNECLRDYMLKKRANGNGYIHSLFIVIVLHRIQA